MENVLILGGSGYVGGAFQSLLRGLGVPFRNVRRAEVDYYDRRALVDLIREAGATFLINAAGYTGKPNVDACELHRAETLLGNAVLPGIVREACEEAGLPWGHVSSGCIFSGRRADGEGFAEEDEPNFSFRSNHCSFYSGSKALGEEVLEGAPDCFVWRLRIPFDEEMSPRNYLVKLLRYDRLLEAENSISHLHEFVRACWECWSRRVPFGTYNVTQPGSVWTSQVVAWMREEGENRKRDGRPNPFDKVFSFFESEEEFMRVAARTPRSNCVLDTDKLTRAGILLRPVEDAVRDSLARLGD